MGVGYVRILTARGRSCGVLSTPRRPGGPAGTARGLSTDPGAHGRPWGHPCCCPPGRPRRPFIFLKPEPRFPFETP